MWSCRVRTRRLKGGQKHMKQNTTPRVAAAARYARQLGLPEIGPAGQAKLGQSRALVVGAGGLGSPVLLYLAAAGVGVIGVADSDTTSPSNLNRQILYSEENLGTAKTDAALERLHGLNSDLTIVTHPVRLTTANAAAIIADYDVIVDCVDTLAARSLINHAALAAGKNVVEAGIEGFHGFVLSVRRGTACAACVQPASSLAGTSPRRGEEAGPPVFGPAAGVAGCLQAAECVKLLLGIGRPLFSRLLLFDILRMEFDELPLSPAPDCPVCGAYR